jgi:hypothetical protein
MGDPRSAPQLLTGSRLLRLGESIEFRFYLPEGVTSGDLEVFPRYLERARPGKRFVPGEPPTWLDELQPEHLHVHFARGEAMLSYTPTQPGSYLARWRAGEETLYRYFAAIEDDWTVLRFSTFIGLESEPTLHGTGIPLDYRLPVERFDLDDPLCAEFIRYQRLHGDNVIPAFADTPDLSVEERVRVYGEGLERVRALMPDPSSARSARVDMRHDLDTGYTETFMRLGVNDHCGLNEANAKPWLGMPEFPYFSSPVDCRKANQEPGGTVVAHQWDFCGGWHFIGPVSWHYKAAEGDWPATERCLRQGMNEFEAAAEMSGHPIFAVPLYDGVCRADYPNPSFPCEVPEPRRFRGEVRDVFVSDRALDEAETRRVMQEGLSAVPEALVAWSLGKGLALPSEDAPVTEAPVPLTGAEFTLGCWVKPGRSQEPWANLLSSHNNDPGGNHRGVSLEQDGERANRFYLIAGTGTGWVGTDTTTQLTAGEWQHFAVVRQGSQLIHYLNGELSAVGQVPAGPLAPATDPFRVGDWARGQASGAGNMPEFVERYQRFVAFELPKQFRVVFARSIDIADYYRRHFELTPRTVFSSKTDHLLYDRWWLCNWCARSELITLDRLPWDTRLSSVFDTRERVHPFKDPLSCEYLLVEDHRRSIRFERECPNPIWWFDYTQQERGPQGSAIAHTRTPDVTVLGSAWERTAAGAAMTLTMQTQARFPNYAVCLWALPADLQPAAERIETTAKEFVLARNADGESHLVLCFDLEPGAQVRVRLLPP